MGTPAVSNGIPAKPDPDTVKFNLWGIEIAVPVPRPMLYAVAIALLLGGTVLFLSKYFVVVQKQVWTTASSDAAAYAQMLPTTELAEFPKHWNEAPKWTLPTPGAAPAQHQPGILPPGMSLAYYESDKCILITRESPGRPRTQHWVVDLGAVRLPEPPPLPGGAKLSEERAHVSGETMLADLKLPPMPGYSPQNSDDLAWGPAPEQKSDWIRDTEISQLQLTPVQMAGGRCVNPHQGAYNQWYGQVNGCFVQVWRQWADGCTHFQWFNRCYNYFDPSINWTHCVH